VSKNIDTNSLVIRGNNRLRAGVVHADWWTNPDKQGAHMGWNRSGTSGRSTFANQQGLGYGGWEWVNYNNNNVQEPAGEPAMQLSREGDLYLRGTINSLDHKTEMLSQNLWKFTNGNTIGSHIHLTKNGKTVTMTLSFCDTTNVAVSAGYLTWQGVLPSWAFIRSGLVGPSVNFHGACTVTHESWQRVAGTLEISYDGRVMILPNKPYNWSGRCGWSPICITYPCD
jgi:hypothetical protein